MDKKRLLVLLLKAPLFLIVIASTAASVYAAYSKQFNISWSTPVLFIIIIILYIIGLYIEKKKGDKNVVSRT